jgi:hypothetical protein
MKLSRRFFIPGVLKLSLLSSPWAHAKTLDLSGFVEPSGAITVLRGGDVVDPYFTHQALLLAKSFGIDISNHSLKWAQWLTQRYHTDHRINRYCKRNDRWEVCQTADADDSTLALWLKFMKQLPLEQQRLVPHYAESLQRAEKQLGELQNKRTGLFEVSKKTPHSLFMDNLEVWTYYHSPVLASSIQKAFWDENTKTYRVSNQESAPVDNKFYPHAAAQIYPLIVHFPLIKGGNRRYYTNWMKAHRDDWLLQIKNDYPWGLIAMTAFEQKDMTTVRMWQKAALPFRHLNNWTLTDEVVAQALPVFNEKQPKDLLRK